MQQNVLLFLFLCIFCGSDGLAQLKLNLGLPPLSIEPWFTYYPEENTFSGFIPMLFDLLNKHSCQEATSSTCLEISLKIVDHPDINQLDLYSGNVEILTNESYDVNLLLGVNNIVQKELIGSLSLYTSFMRGAVAIVKGSSNTVETAFKIFDPFTTELWLLICTSAFFGGMILVLLKVISTGKGCDVSSYSTLVYHTFASLLAGDEYDVYHTTPLGRVYRLGLLFLVLILGATYTANLAAFLLNSDVRVKGPTSMDQLQYSTACIPIASTWNVVKEKFVQGSFTPQLDEPVTPDKFVQAMVNKCMQSLSDSSSDVLIMDQPNLIKFFTFDRYVCNNYLIVDNINFSPLQTYVVTLAQNDQIMRAVNDAILFTKETKEYHSLVKQWMREGKTCEDESSDTDPIGIEPMSGAFIIFALSGVLAVIGAIYQKIETGTISYHEEDEERNDIKEILRRLRRMKHLQKKTERKTYQIEGDNYRVSSGMMLAKVESDSEVEDDDGEEDGDEEKVINHDDIYMARKKQTSRQRDNDSDDEF